MLKTNVQIELKLIDANTGQLPWLPKNPRQWTKGDVDRTAASIREDPDFLEDRPLLVVPHGKRFVVFAGNLRREGCIAEGLKEVPTVVYYATSAEDRITIKRRAMKDNGSFGSWDFDELANSWDDLPLVEFGVPAWEDKKPAPGPEGFGEEFSLPSGEGSGFQQMTFQLADEQVEEIKEALKEAKTLTEYSTMITFGNSNSNANALSLIIEQWIESRK